MKDIVCDNVVYEHKLSNTQNTFFPEHLHHEWEIYFFKSGDVRYIVDNQLIQLQKNDLLLIRPLMFHRAIIDSDIQYERVIFTFPANIISQSIIESANVLPIKINIDNQSFLKNLIQSVEYCSDECDKNTTQNVIVKTIELLFLHLIPYCNQSMTNPPQNLFNHLFSDILNYIDEHIGEKLSLEKLSKQFYTSKSWLSHSFKQNQGVSCIKYINAKRILAAQRLIRQGVAPTEAFYKYSYTDYSTFFRQYRQITGSSPEQDKPSK